MRHISQNTLNLNGGTKNVTFSRYATDMHHASHTQTVAISLKVSFVLVSEQTTTVNQHTNANIFSFFSL